MGRLHTCYAPVRRSPSNQASLINAAPRLACVKPIASVHPEPGSNSSLLYFLASFAFFSSLTVRFFPFPYTTFRCFIFSKNSCAPTSNEISFFSIRAFAFVFLVETDCKVMYFFWTDKIFSQKFFIFFFSTLLTLQPQLLSIADAKVLLFLIPANYFYTFFWIIFYLLDLQLEKFYQ